MITRSFQAKILVFAVFFIGIASGVLIANFYESRVMSTQPAASENREKAQRSRRDVNKVHDYLGLNPDQRERVSKVLEETRSEFQKLRAETQPRFAAIQEGSRAKIREILTDEQRQKYDEFRRKMDQRRRDHDRDNDHDRRDQRPK